MAHIRRPPPAYTVDADSRPLQSWRILILPYLDDEEKELYNEIRLDEPWDSDHNSQFHKRIPDILICPSANEQAKKNGWTSYNWIIGPRTISDGPGTISRDRITAIGGEIILEVIPSRCWMEPSDIPQADLAKGVDHSPTEGIGSPHRKSMTIGRSNMTAITLEFKDEKETTART